MNKTKKFRKNAQLSIFVMIALIIVVVIAVIFLVLNKDTKTAITPETSEDYIKECSLGILEDFEDSILENNLKEEIRDNYILYNSGKIPYFCKASQFYAACINQYPAIITNLEDYAETYIRKELETCFTKLRTGLKEKGYEVQDTDRLDFKVNIVSGKIKIEMDKKITIKKAEYSKVLDNFKAEIKSPVYELASTAKNIVNYESTLCEFNAVNWMMYYRDIKISLFRTSEQTKVYTLTERNTEKSIKFAVKTCVLPAGI
jgi:hypothetical protein